MTNLPENFQIVISSREEFNLAWAELSAAGYNITHHRDEQSYKSGGVIKHTTTLDYIWSSRMHDTSKKAFASFAEFKQRYSDIFRPSMQDAIALVELNEDVKRLEVILAERERAVAAQKTLIDQKKEQLVGLQKKLGITA